MSNLTEALPLPLAGGEPLAQLPVLLANLTGGLTAVAAGIVVTVAAAHGGAT